MRGHEAVPADSPAEGARPVHGPPQHRFVGSLERALGHLLVVLMAVMVLDVTWQVTSRYLLRSPSSFTEELAGFLLIWIGLLGSAYALRTRAHLGIDLLTERLGGVARMWTGVLTHTLVLLFAASVMVVGGLRLVFLAFQLQQISAAMGVRMGYVYLAVPLAGALMVLFAAAEIGEEISGARARARGVAGPVAEAGGSVGRDDGREGDDRTGPAGRGETPAGAEG